MPKIAEVARAIWQESVGPAQWQEWDKLPADAWGRRRAMAQARAAIEAMREPSGAMVRACFAVSSSGWPQVIWPAMIDAALNERSDLT